MDTPCPFWEGKRVRDTHLLALIPSHVVGKPLTLDYLGKLSKDPKEGYGRDVFILTMSTQRSEIKVQTARMGF